MEHYSLNAWNEDSLHGLVDLDVGATPTQGVKVGHPMDDEMMQKEGVAVDLDRPR